MSCSHLNFTKVIKQSVFIDMYFKSNLSLLVNWELGYEWVELTIESYMLLD